MRDHQGNIESMTPEQQQASWRTKADQLLIENERLRGIVQLWEEFDFERDNPKRLTEHILALMVERDRLKVENDELRAHLFVAGQRLGRLSTVLTASNRNDQAVRAWEWSHEAFAIASGVDGPDTSMTPYCRACGRDLDARHTDCV